MVKYSIKKVVKLLRFSAIIIRRNKWINILNVLISTLFFLTMLITIISVNHTIIESDSLIKFKDKNAFHLVDDLVGEKEENFLSEPQNYNKLHSFSNELASSSYFTYYLENDQPIGVAEFQGKEFLNAFYESGEEPVVYERGHTIFNVVKSVQINKSVIEMNDLKLSEGRFFGDEEYLFTGREDYIPVILGFEYVGDYQLGDKIIIEHYSKITEAKIIGILEPSQHILDMYRNPDFLLDRYMILPTIYFDELPSTLIDRGEIDRVFLIASLFSVSNGIILTESSALEIRKQLSEVSERTNFYDFQIIGANSFKIDSLFALTQISHTNMIIIVVISFLIMLGLFLFTLTNKINKNLESYSVLLINGADIYSKVCLLRIFISHKYRMVYSFSIIHLIF